MSASNCDHCGEPVYFGGAHVCRGMLLRRRRPVPNFANPVRPEPEPEEKDAPPDIKC